ncbi:MAG: hypothetical protein A2583_05335 [Bdellovibrionales bacterium RIFOXYD1_FULL_53_11]|nr:MAG: hypothetical protein A2583_05335 [Bdellovibrionales bacterium RIFOXYD1_FULL_53_11]
METREQAISKLTSLLANNAVFAILFGSARENRLGAESDIDVGIFLKKPPENAKKKLEFLSRLSRNFSRDLDTVILNTSDVIITAQILANGEVILNNNPHALIAFKSRKISEYIDFKRSRKIIEDRLVKGIKNA